MFRLILGLALVSLVVAEGPSLAVYKELDSEYVVIGKNLTVTVRIFNLGDSAATSVDVDDSQWGRGVTGKKTTFESIAPGANVTFQYVVLPVESGLVAVQPTKVTFKVESGNEVREAYSNFVYDTSTKDGLSILTPEEYEAKSSMRTKEWITFALLLVIPLGMPFFFYKQSSNNLKERRIAHVKADEARSKARSPVGRKGSPSRSGSPGKKSKN